MGLRDALLRLLSRGEAPEADPDDWCELVTVALFEAPLVVNELEAHDIEVTQQDALDHATRSLNKVTLLVRRSQLAAAEAVTAS